MLTHWHYFKTKPDEVESPKKKDDKKESPDQQKPSEPEVKAADVADADKKELSSNTAKTSAPENVSQTDTNQTKSQDISQLPDQSSSSQPELATVKAAEPVADVKPVNNDKVEPATPLADSKSKDVSLCLFNIILWTICLFALFYSFMRQLFISKRIQKIAKVQMEIS